MLIKYKPKVEHLKCIPLIPDPKDPKSYSRNNIMLIPGTNEITDEEWAAIQSLITTEIKNKEIVQIMVESKKTKNGKARNLCDVPSNIARDIITKCSNPATLKKWFKEETRDEVLLAVTKRMRKLKLDPDDLQKEIDKESGEETLTEDDGLTDDTSSEDDGGDDDLGTEDDDSEGGDDLDLIENDGEDN
jgi:hypothetical protein